MVNILRNYKIMLSFSHTFSLIFSYLNVHAFFIKLKSYCIVNIMKSLIAFVFMSAHLRQELKNTLNE